MHKPVKISICGDICSECPRYLATQANDIPELKRMAELWYRLGFRERELNYEVLKCSGCSKDKICSFDIIIAKI